jgi:hypothetical protein
LSHRGQQVELETAGRCPGINGLPKTHKPNTEILQLVEQEDEMLETAPQPIQLPDEEGISLATLRIRDEPI